MSPSFSSDIDAVRSLNDSIQTQFADLRSTQDNLSAEKECLAEQKAQVASIRQSLAAEKQKIDQGCNDFIALLAHYAVLLQLKFRDATIMIPVGYISSTPKRGKLLLLYLQNRQRFRHESEVVMYYHLLHLFSPRQIAMDT